MCACMYIRMSVYVYMHTHIRSMICLHDHINFGFNITEPFRWVMAWRDMIPVHHFVALLEGHFFPKWHQVS